MDNLKKKKKCIFSFIQVDEALQFEYVSERLILLVIKQE